MSVKEKQNVETVYNFIDNNQLDKFILIISNQFIGKDGVLIDFKDEYPTNIPNLYLYSVRMGRLNFINYMEDKLECDWSIWFITPNGYIDGFHVACEHNNFDIIEHFIRKHKYDVNTKSSSGQSGVYRVIMHGDHVDTIKLLYENGLDFKSIGYSGFNIYEKAVHCKRLKIVKYLDSIYNFELSKSKLNSLIESCTESHAQVFVNMGVVYDKVLFTEMMRYLNRRKYKRKFAIIENKSVECCICLEKFKNDDECCKCVNGHTVHNECYIEYMVSKGLLYEIQCVTCKKKMVTGGYKYI